MSVLALIPARKGSKGIPGKNLRTLDSPKEGNRTLIAWAVYCAQCADIDQICVSTDYEVEELDFWLDYRYQRPAELAQDETPMIDVVRDVLEQIPGPPEQIIVLLQPTAVFRQPKHITAAIAILGERAEVDCVVSVVQLPATHHAACQFDVADGRLWQICSDIWDLPSRRQDMDPVYIRDGTVYAFRRLTVEQHGTIYGRYMCPLIIPPDESCSLDTEQDWADVERRFNARQAARS